MSKNLNAAINYSFNEMSAVLSPTEYMDRNETLLKVKRIQEKHFLKSLIGSSKVSKYFLDEKEIHAVKFFFNGISQFEFSVNENVNFEKFFGNLSLHEDFTVENLSAAFLSKQLVPIVIGFDYDMEHNYTFFFSIHLENENKFFSLSFAGEKIVKISAGEEAEENFAKKAKNMFI